MKAVYPIILTPAERGYVVFVPDLDINTEGEDLADAIEMARDAIGLWGITEEDAGRKIPQASGTMPHPEEQEIVTLVDIDFAAYRRANDLRTVRKNVTLPSWLNDLAERNGVNFSQVLQESLKERLHVATGERIRYRAVENAAFWLPGIFLLKRLKKVSKTR
mgnify:CR=1 FL=1